MPKTKISEWSSTPANNTDIDSINIAEGCAPSGINDAIRELMSQVKDLYSGTTGDAIGIAGGGTGQVTATAAFNALAPSQTSNSGKYLKTDGTNTSWATVSGSQWTTSGATIYYTTGAVFVGASSVIALENLGVTYSSNTNYGLALNDTAGNNGATSIAFYSAGTLKGSIGYNGTATTFKTSASGVQLNDSGVTFPATQSASTNANTLDDYEEGTWTATVTDGTNNATMGNNQGRYTKIGRTVAIQMSLNTTSIGSVTGNIYISGLPFISYYNAAEGNTGYSVSGTRSVVLNLAAAGQSVVISTDQNTTNLIPYVYTSTAGTTQMTATQIGSGGYIIFGLTYVTS